VSLTFDVFDVFTGLEYAAFSFDPALFFSSISARPLGEGSCECRARFAGGAETESAGEGRTRLEDKDPTIVVYEGECNMWEEQQLLLRLEYGTLMWYWFCSRRRIRYGRLLDEFFHVS